jgi:hypothetical protein
MKILLAGLIGRYPVGGVTWCSLMYLLGLRELGHEVFYVEDTGECAYDPDADTISPVPAYATAYIDAALRPFELGERWTFVNFDGTYHGQSREVLRTYCADAELFINLSGGSWFWRDEYRAIPRKVFIDSDPAFTQLALAKGDPWYVAFFREFDHLFTFGSNIGSAAAILPADGFTWHKTWQPVVTKLWQCDERPVDRSFTSVLSWRIKSFADLDGNKDREFRKFLDLPAHTPSTFRLAVNGPHELLRQHGWDTVDALVVSRTPASYRQFIVDSYAEFGVAKHGYVQTCSGWFSDRTECYLAAGRPALVQDTGWTAHLPSGAGLLAFSSIEEAVEGLARISADYASHARHAALIAQEHFEAAGVLRTLLERAGV